MAIMRPRLLSPLLRHRRYALCSVRRISQQASAKQAQVRHVTGSEQHSRNDVDTALFGGERPAFPSLQRYGKAGLTLQREGRSFDFDRIWLRDSCSCSECVDPYSGNKNFQTAHIPDNIEIAEASDVSDTSVLLRWNNDIEGFSKTHETVLAIDRLVQHAEYGAKPSWPEPKLWTEETSGQGFRLIPYKDFIGDERAFGEALLGLHDNGLILLDEIPEADESVERILERIGPLRSTFYGRTWNVKDKPKAENVAYTAKHLGMHMDLLYMKDPPGIQLLHCLRSSCKGGDSIFHDSFRSAYDLKLQSPKAFDDLVRIFVRYKYDVGGYFYTDSKPTIELVARTTNSNNFNAETEDSQIAYVNWSPPFQGTFEVGYSTLADSNDMEDYLKASKLFASLVDDPSRQFRHRLEPGQCVLFNNRRILHGRTKFDSGTGERWLRGAYVNTEDFRSALHKQLAKQWQSK